ncbi:hypothetical protein [Mycetocola spongiae]|uniref:hypothetical protein n=1 Tax=Mycetocola spongiae TaxID=2859226 RepID=UPI001CF442D7|nr:hypothetical protein [Mycetocola spongiae]UCR89695.1 hypothetical protein KXZ72_03180 [Mycetocola spongiae]
MTSRTGREQLHDSISNYEAGDLPVARISDCICDCGSEVFSLGFDDDRGVAVRLCFACDSEVALLDSQEVLDHADSDIDLDAAECTCGGIDFTVAVGFAISGNDVRWVSVGLRCEDCAIAGVYTDWAIGYSPSMHLLERI